MICTAATLLPAHNALAQTTNSTEGVAAVVNDQVISFSDVRDRASMVLLGFGAQITSEAISQVVPRVLQTLIDEKLKTLEAAKFEVDIDSQTIDAHFEALAARNNISAQELTSDLQERGINPQTLRERIRADLAWQRVVTGLYGSRVRISQSQVEQALEQWNRLSRNEQFRVAEILLPATTDSEKASALRVAWQLYEQIAQGARFDLLAQRYSTAVTAAGGGEIGWLSQPDLPPELAQFITALPDGGLSEPIITSAGVYLVALIERRVSLQQDQIPVLLKQAVGWSADTRSELETLIASQVECEQLESGPRGTISIVDLGEVTPATLDDQSKTAVLDAGTGNWTPIIPYGNDGALAAILVCQTVASAPGIPDRSTIENRIYEQQLNLLASRHLRNLRRSATIIRPERVLR